MVDAHDDPPLESRPPRLDDLLTICRGLNAVGARYLVVGGMAVVRLGFVRATEDIDLLIDASEENVERVKSGLMVLPDGAARQVLAGDLLAYVVVRVADEVVVDLMASACGLDYQAAASDVELVNLQGVTIPFASARLLLAMKQTVRAKDVLDREFLTRLLGEAGDA